MFSRDWIRLFSEKRAKVRGLMCVLCLWSSVIVAGATAGEMTTHVFDIPSQSADIALIEFAEQAGRTLLFSFDETHSKQTNPLNGQYEVMEALRLLLANTGLAISIANEGQFSVAQHVDINGDKAVKISKKKLWAPCWLLFSYRQVLWGKILRRCLIQ